MTVRDLRVVCALLFGVLAIVFLTLAGLLATGCTPLVAFSLVAVEVALFALVSLFRVLAEDGRP